MSSPTPAPSGMFAWPSYVLGRLHRETRAVVEEALREAELELRDYFTLVHIDELVHASQQDVADRARMDRSDLVKILDGLEQRGLITRERDPADRRRHVLTLTPVGQAARERGTVASQQATRRAFSALTDEELGTLHQLALKALAGTAGVDDAH